jgi:hypothetical protein
VSNAYSSNKSSSTPTQATVTSGDAPAGSSVGSSSPVNAGSLQFAASGSSRIDTSPLVVQSALDAVSGAVGQALQELGNSNLETLKAIQEFVTGQTSSTTSVLSDSNLVLRDVLEKQSALAAQTQSEGATENQKTLLYVVGAVVLAMLGSLFFFTRK